MFTDPVPCSSTITDTMKQLHQWLTAGISITALMTLGVLLDRLRMMWSDYRKRHRINGSADL